MMNSEDKFKELLRQKLNEKEFPFKPGNWEKAQQMIDASRERKRRRAGFLILALLLLTLGSVSLFIMNGSETTLAQAKNILGPPQQEVAEPRMISKQVPEAKVTMAPASPILNGKQFRDQDPQDQTKVVEKASSNNIPISAQTLAAPKAKPASLPDLPAQNVQALPEETELPAPTLERQEVIVSQLAVTAMATPETPEQTKTESELIETVSRPEKNKEEESPAKNLVPTEPVGEQTPAVLKTDEALSESDAAQSMSSAESLNAAGLPKDSLPIASGSFTVPPPDQSLLPKNLFYLEAGSNYLLGWKDQGKKDANGFNPVFGIGYLNFITKKIGLSFGIQYSSVGNLSNYSHSSKVTKMGLGEESAVTVISPVKMHYVSGVLKINLIANAKNVIGLGYTLAYLFAMENRMETYEQLTNFAPAQHTVSKTDGYAQGFNAFDSQLSVFYRRILYKNLSLNTEFLFGISDVKNNAFFGSAIYERNLGLKLSLMYNLFRK